MQQDTDGEFTCACLWLLPETAGEGWARVWEKGRRFSAGNNFPVLTRPNMKERRRKEQKDRDDGNKEE